MTKYCPSCGTTNEEQAKFCTNCGQTLGQAANAVPHNVGGSRTGSECVWCNQSAGYNKEEGRLDSKWGMTSHKFEIYICNNCGIVGIPTSSVVEDQSGILIDKISEDQLIFISILICLKIFLFFFCTISTVHTVI